MNARRPDALICILIALVAMGATGACSGGGGCAEGEEVSEDSDLVYVDLECGDGDSVSHGDVVVVRYSATLEDGTEFDASPEAAPFEVPLESDKVIPGWFEGLEGMRVGGRRELVVPPELAYGNEGLAGRIPPNTTVTYVVELVEVRGPSRSR